MYCVKGNDNLQYFLYYCKKFLIRTYSYKITISVCNRISLSIINGCNADTEDAMLGI